MTITTNSIINTLNQYGISNKLEQAHFLGQCDIESAGFTRFSESLNYTAEALLKLWPNRFTPETAAKYGRTPQHPADQRMIANIAYGSRMGNEKDGTNDDDGWNYRGAGLIQLTGKANHLDFLQWFNKRGNPQHLTIENIGDYLRTDDGAILSAIYFWLSRSCGVHAQIDDVAGLTRVINGCDLNSVNGKKEVTHRQAATDKYKQLLGISL